MQTAIADIRKEYLKQELDEKTVGDNPMVFFASWFSEAMNAGAEEVNAMTLATVDAEGQPHARIVLLKSLEHGGFTFFTNYESNKGNQITTNPHGALVFFWKELERQVRVEGTISRIPPEASDEYYISRPAGSRLGAWTSPQSQPIPDRDFLEKRMDDMRQEHGEEPKERPANWGGYVLVPQKIEFWQGRASRLHDRIVFELIDNSWEKYRIAP